MNTPRLHVSYYPSRNGEASETLLLLNSLGTSTRMWQPIMPAVLEHVNVLTFDYPGHGESPVSERPSGLDEIAELASQLLDRFELTAVHVAGISIGGMVALRMAAIFPTRVLSVSVICSALHMDLDLWLNRVRMVEEWGTRALIPGMMARWFTPDFQRHSPEVVAEHQRMLLECADEGYKLHSRILAGADLRPGLSDVVAPALVIAGAKDPAVPVEQAEEMVHRLLNGRLRILEDAAHMAVAMEPGQVSSLLVEHMRASSE